MLPRLLVLNLPYPRPVVRKYQCSYYAQGFLMPPVELAYLASSILGWGKAKVRLIDAIAEQMDRAETIAAVRHANPDVVVSLLGFGTFPRGIAALTALKAAMPQTLVLCFGYLPTLFPEQVLAHCAVDGVLMGEPELTLAELLDRRSRGQPLAGLPGLACRDARGRVHVGPRREHIADLDTLPFLDLSLLKLPSYAEPLLGREIAPMLAVRGCPFPCTYCVTTYGTKVVTRSVESLLGELEQMHEQHGIRAVRFFGDTFTYDRDWVLDLCRGLRDRSLNFRWTCRTRADRVDDEMLAAMKAAGCARLYVGIESGSQKVLDFYRKQYTVEETKAGLDLIRRHGIETLGFFIVGAPVETEQDLEASIRLAKEAKLNYVLVTRLQYWPGTPLFEQHRDRVDFQLFPFHHEVKEEPADHFLWESRFYRRFYFSPGHVLRKLRNHWLRPLGLIQGLYQLVRYLFSVERRLTDDFI